PAAISSRVGNSLVKYFGLERDFPGLADTLPWRSDPHLARCLIGFQGLTILRQPFGETLLCFLCSATKQIVQIKQMVALLASRHGALLCHENRNAVERVAPNAPAGERVAVNAFNRLPTWPELAQTSEAELRACML